MRKVFIFSLLLFGVTSIYALTVNDISDLRKALINNDKVSNIESYDLDKDGSLTINDIVLNNIELHTPTINYIDEVTEKNNNSDDYYKSVSRIINIESISNLTDVKYCITTNSSCTPDKNYTVSSNKIDMKIEVEKNDSEQKICVYSKNSDGLERTSCDTKTYIVKGEIIEAPTFLPGVADVTYTEEQIKQLASNMNNNLVGKKIKLNPKVYSVYVPTGTDDEWYYNHYPEITKYNGLFIATWTSAKRDEDSAGQRVMMSYSKDLMNWSDPKPIFDSETYSDPNVVFTGTGFGEYNGVLYSYATACIPAGRNCKWYYTSTTDGKNWTNIAETRHNDAYNSKQLRSGRFLNFSRGTVFAYTDIEDAYTGRGYNWIQQSIADKFNSAINRGAMTLIESNFFQDKDGVVYMMFRSGNGNIWVSVSCNEGETWSEIYPTNISDGDSKARFGTLPDGRYYFIGNIEKSRTELIIAISDDGINFSKQYIIKDDIDYEMQKDGKNKNGYNSYPQIVIDNNYMYVIYTKRKEAVDVAKIPLADL